MTNCNYTELSNQELVDKIQSFGFPSCYLKSRISKIDKSLIDELFLRTQFLDNWSDNVPISCRIYCLNNDINSVPICKLEGCTNLVKWDRGDVKFTSHCCISHSNRDNKVKTKKQLTCIKNFGVPNPSQSSDVKKKMHDTNMRLYNGIGFSSNKILAKIQETNKQKYGVENASQSEIVKCKVKNTCNERYGGIGLGSDILSNKIQNTIHETYGCEYPNQSITILNKTRQTNLLRYGVQCVFQNEEIKQKIAQTNIERYGTDNPMESQIVQERYKQTCIERYGVEYYTQTNEYHTTAHKKYTNEKYPDMTFGSSWEFKVYDFLKEHDIEFEYQPSISFEYEYDGRTWTYHPDFLINGKVYEVKGEQFFRINETTGKEEMFCPYRYDYQSDEQYNLMCEKYEAKYQCMLKNDVIILRYKQVQNLSEIFTSQIL